MLYRIFYKIRLRNYLPERIKERTNRYYKQTAGHKKKQFPISYTIFK